MRGRQFSLSERSELADQAKLKALNELLTWRDLSPEEIVELAHRYYSYSHECDTYAVDAYRNENDEKSGYTEEDLESDLDERNRIEQILADVQHGDYRRMREDLKNLAVQWPFSEEDIDGVDDPGQKFKRWAELIPEYGEKLKPVMPAWKEYEARQKERLEGKERGM